MSNQKASPTHEEFQLGNGYGSAEKASEAEHHKSKKQFGDNPLPKSGGGYAKAGAVQPKEEPATPNTKERPEPLKEQKQKKH